MWISFLKSKLREILLKPIYPTIYGVWFAKLYPVLQNINEIQFSFLDQMIWCPMI